MARPLLPFDQTVTQLRDAALAEAERLSGGRRPFNAKQVQALFDQALKDGDAVRSRAAIVGYALGALMVDKGKLEWKVAYDEYSPEPVVARGETFCAPILMMGRRLEAGEATDIERLIKDTLATIQDAEKERR